jgi:hypothetical protein
MKMTIPKFSIVYSQEEGNIIYQKLDTLPN